jgi:hypothetical protein
LVELFSEGHSELYLARIVKQFDHQQAVFDLEPGPYLFDTVRLDKYRVLLVELLVPVDAFLVDHHQSLLPAAQDRRFLADFAEVKAVLDQHLGNARQRRGLAFEELLAHIDQLLLDHEGEDEVVYR